MHNFFRLVKLPSHPFLQKLEYKFCLVGICGRGCFAIGRAGEHSCKPLILFQTTPAGIVAEPQELAVDVGHLS